MNDPLDMINAMGIAAARLSPSNALEINSNIKKGHFQTFLLKS